MPGENSAFSVEGLGYPQDDDTPNYTPDSKSSVLELSNELSFVSEFFGIVIKIAKNVF